MIRLRVWANARPMGWFGHEAAEFFFDYDPQWLEQPGAYVLAPQFALRPGRIAGALGRLGAELPGVLSLLPEDVRPTLAQEYRPLSFEALSLRLGARDRTPLLVSNAAATMSLAGAQDKIGLRFDARAKRLSDSVGQSPTTHILKPDTRQARYAPSAINEYACMKLARALKLQVPDVWLLRVPEPVYVIERYDRWMTAGNIVGLHQIDGCQLLGHGSGWKYERSGGLVSIPKLVEALRALRVRGSDLLRLQRWVMFNYLIGNSDAHAKNLSVLIDDKGYALAPFYDLLCVRAYGDTGLALFIGDEETFDAVGHHSWEALCKDCDFRLPETLIEFRKMALALLPAWQKVRMQLDKQHPPTVAEAEVLERMTQVFELHSGHALSMAGPPVGRRQLSNR